MKFERRYKKTRTQQMFWFFVVPRTGIEPVLQP